MDEASRSLWERVCATVTRLGQPKGSTVYYDFTPSPPCTTLDLHGYWIEDAYHEVKDFLANVEAKNAVVITGKSGVIKKEFPFWMEHLGYTFELLENGGSYRVKTRYRPS